MKSKLNLKNSDILYKESFKLVPGGVLGVRRPYNFIINEYPNFLESGKGSKIYDVDGNEYIDMLAAYGPIIIGYREQEIDNEVINQIKNKGFCMTLTQSSQNKLVKKLQSVVPSCEKAIIVKTGSDASTLSIRIARGFTNKEKILRCDYHGWHDWSVFEKGGIPLNSYKDIIEFKYNDLDNLEQLFKNNKDKVAAVIIQPIYTPLVKEVQFPKDNYLKEVKKICKFNNALLIFDEIRSGLRVNIGGAQKLYNIDPDITLIGKAMANGYPISAVVGKKDIMNVVAHKVFVSSTFFPNSLEQVAAIKTIDFLQQNKVLEDIKFKGNSFAKKIMSTIDKFNINCNFTGYPWMPFISFNNYEETINRKMRTIFYSYLIRSGVFFSPFHHGYIMFRHSENDLDNIVDRIESAFNYLKKNF